MNSVEVFYRGREIIKKIKVKYQPFVIQIKEGHIEITFAKNFGNEFSKNERDSLLKIIVDELLWSCRGGGSLTDHLLERLERSLLEIKKEIKRDFDMPMKDYKG